MEACQQEVIEIEDADEIEGGNFCTEDLRDDDLLCIRRDKWLNDKVINKLHWINMQCHLKMSPAS